MNKMLSKAVSWLQSLVARVANNGTRQSPAVPEEAAWQFVETVMREHHFTLGARAWLKSEVRLRVDDLASTRGGGYWQPSTREVRLFTGQHEAAVHELAHAWWHYRRERLKDEMIEATVRLSAEQDPRYGELARLAFGYVHGIPEQLWEGLLVTRNDWEMFAGIASGTMGDMRKLPPYMRRLYDGLFEMPSEP
ncbi:MAG: hypothetical protein M3437_16660 [Chloroflexota bacterium]|nr:hypothetical protein [Chloroflexota bacterium]MDQ5866713.1 hypothetical protein [Chloroflexota bacterium]